MNTGTSYRDYAADCVRQAQSEESTSDRSILLNVALAWLRLAQQVETLDQTESPSTVPDEFSQHTMSS